MYETETDGSSLVRKLKWGFMTFHPAPSGHAPAASDYTNY